MIVVRKEDHTKLAILGIALTVVLSFSGYRVMSMVNTMGGSRSLATRPTAQAMPKTETVASKPKIVMAYAEMPAPKEPDPFRKIIVDKDSHQANMKPMTALPVAGADGLKPLDIGGFAVKAIVEPPLRLDGVLSGRSGTAIVTMGERTDVLAIGGSLGEYTLVRVDRQSATFSCKRGPVRLLVGEEAKAPPPPPPPTPKLPPITMMG